jgi:V/A-type H+/Na+-transporting ATPase subunit B
VGEAGLSDADRRALAFAERFEREFVAQERRRSLDETLAVGWRLLESLPRDDLLRLADRTWAEHQAHAKPSSR